MSDVNVVKAFDDGKMAVLTVTLSSINRRPLLGSTAWRDQIKFLVLPFPSLPTVLLRAPRQTQKSMSTLCYALEALRYEAWTNIPRTPERSSHESGWLPTNPSDWPTRFDDRHAISRG